MRPAAQLSRNLERFAAEDAGASLIEFALVGSLVLAVCLLLLLALTHDG